MYIFTNTPFKWTAAGTPPTESEITLGLQGGSALPAAFVNAQWTETYNAIKEVQRLISGGAFNVVSLEVGDSNTMPDPTDLHFSAAFGSGNNVGTSDSSLAVGLNNTVTGFYSFACGNGNSANTGAALDFSAAIGTNCTAANCNFVVGKYNKTPTAGASNTSTGDLFIVGNGIQGGAKSNALRVTADGQVMGTQAYQASGADFAECFEWLDGNPENEDRRGLFVTLDGEKIRPAKHSDDYILGVVSSTPTVIGDSYSDDWHGKYVTDVFGERVLENGAWKLSDGFDEKKDSNYTSRLKRPEWAAVGLVGKLIVRDDGRCQPNGHCLPSENGIATPSGSGYRVMARIDDTHIKVLIK